MKATPSSNSLSRPHAGTGRRGFVLLEVMLAVFIFAFAIIGLARALNKMIDVELISRDEQRIRLELESRLAEAKIERLEPGVTELEPDAMGMTYVREIEVLELENIDDIVLQNLLTLRIRALRNGDEINSAEVYVYQP